MRVPYFHLKQKQPIETLFWLCIVQFQKFAMSNLLFFYFNITVYLFLRDKEK